MSSKNSSARQKSPDKKKKTSAKASTTPTTVLDKILVAIRSQPHTSEKGISRTAIAKYLQTEYKYDNPTALKRALQNAVTSKTLIQTGQSFRVAGDPVVSIPTIRVTVEDLIVGTKSEAKVGDTVTVKYEGKLDDGTVFDSANSFSFTLGAGDVIKGTKVVLCQAGIFGFIILAMILSHQRLYCCLAKGWDQGIVGMKLGGKRKLLVPSQLGYGKRGSAPDIPPNADLHFIVTLQKIT